MASIEELAGTLQGLVGPGIKRKELVAAVREKHPKASKKDIVRAAFYALTSAVDGDVERAQRLHDFPGRGRQREAFLVLTRLEADGQAIKETLRQVPRWRTPPAALYGLRSGTDPEA